MGLRILLSFFLFIKLGVLSLTINTSPKPNPFTVDLEKIAEKSKYKKILPKDVIKLPAPNKVSSRKPELTEHDLRLAMICSKKATSDIELCRSNHIANLDNVSISSASTFNYEFEAPKGTAKKSTESRSSSASKERDEENIDELLEDAIRNMDNERRFTLDEIERRRKLPPKLPSQMNKDDYVMEQNRDLGDASFLTGIRLIDDIISPKKKKSSVKVEEKQDQAQMSKITPIPKSDPISLPKPSEDGKEKIPQISTTQKIPPTPAIQKIPSKPVIQEISSTPATRRIPPTPTTQGIPQIPAAQGISQTPTQRNFKKTPEKQDQGKTTDKGKEKTRFNIKNVFNTKIFKTCFEKKKEPDSKQKHKKNIVISRPILQSLTEQDKEKQIKGAEAADKIEMIPATTKKTPHSVKGENDDEEQKIRRDSIRKSTSKQPEIIDGEGEIKSTPIPAKRTKPGLKPVAISQQDSEQESGKVTPRPQSSQGETGSGEKMSNSERKSLSSVSGIIKSEEHTERYPSTGSDQLFFDLDNDMSQSASFDFKETDELPKFEHKKVDLQEFKHLSSGTDFDSNSEFSLSNPSVSFQNTLEGINTGLSKLHQDRRVYEKFVPERGFDRILQKKLINTYDSGDEIVENSVFDRLKNKVKRRHNEAKRKKERSRGIPSRVITKKDVDELGDLKQTEFQVGEQREILPRLSDNERKPSESTALSEVTEFSPKDLEIKTDSTEPVNEEVENDRDNVRKIIEKYRDLEIKKSDVESDLESLNSFGMENELVQIQNPLEVLTYKDELKQLKYARDDYFRNKFLRGLAEEAKKEESDKLSSQIAEKEALLQELEKISNELDKKRTQINALEERPIDEGVTSEDQNSGDDSLKTFEPEKENRRDASTEMNGKEKEESIYPEGSLKLDEDAVILGAERKETNKGIVVLDPENANYEIYFDNKADKDEEGLIPSMEYYNEEEGLMPIQQSDKLSDNEGLAPVGGFTKLQELQAFEENDRSLLPPPEESNIPFEEIYLTKHPELLNTDTVSNLNREKAIKKAFEHKPAKGGVLRKREFENFDLSNDAIERLKR
ncbi:signal peptide containing [Cryptosporidium sp. chipmunk genotype I]|uniref:signal peptide containing n=1 Tax=Cryptosporidium sp. chipmunk genotype I TaxID=1280935 RepID=UPI00351A0D50|nr:signal peptide containing [Cryptosporidium sp. chipmunk genotype I]